jgi:predicted HD superfamily hydrolase involved in NAD metabolism
LPPNCPSEVAHQFLGEYIAREELGVEDKDVLNAIKYHTTGRDNMSTLEKVVYVADLIEPSRKYEGVNELRKVIDKDFESVSIWFYIYYSRFDEIGAR